MVTTKQKPIENTQKGKKKDQSTSLQKVIKSHRRKAREEERTYETARKQLTYCQQKVLIYKNYFKCKRHRVAEWIKKDKTQKYAAWRDSFSYSLSFDWTIQSIQIKKFLVIYLFNFIEA